MRRPRSTALPAAPLLVALLAGCGGGGSSGASSGSRSVSYRVVGSKVSGPDTISVARDTRLTITVTTDHADELHVHGYDEEVELAAGEPGRVVFVADEVGRFEVETHERDLLLANLVVR